MNSRSHKVRMSHTAPPTFMPGMLHKQDYLFIEAAPLINNKEYRKFILKVRKEKPELYTIMDNSAYIQGTPISEKEFMALYELVLPACIIATDHLYKRQATIDSTEAFIAKYKNKIDAKIMAVAQGETFADYMVCFHRFMRESGVDVVGINMCMDWSHPDLDKLPKCERMQRHRHLILYNAHNTAESAKRPLHLLGLILGRELDFIRRNNLHMVRSCDSSSAFMHGFHGVRYTEKGLTEKLWDKKIDFDIKILSKKQRADISYNIDMIDAFRGAV